MKTTTLRCLTALGLMLLATSSVRADDGDGTSDIINGTVDNGDFSVVMLRNAGGGGFCSGTLISRLSVLTAAHCFDNNNAATVGFGVNGNTSFATVVRTYVHPDWDGEVTHGNDLAILLLDAPVASTVATPSLISTGGEQTPTKKGDSLRIVGFGRNTPTGGFGTKREATVSLNLAAPRRLNFGDANGQKCRGDSGGPTFFRGSDGVERVVGVSSYSTTDCDEGSNDSRVDAYLSFIHQYTRPFDLVSSKTATGDFDGDGFADQLVLLDHGNSSASLIVYPGGTGAGTATTPYRAWFGGTNSLTVSLSKVTAGDFNGDGKSDLIILYDYGPYLGWASAGLIVIPGTSIRREGFTTPIEVWRAGSGSFDVNLAKIASGDFNGDGKADLIALYDYSQFLGWASAGLFVFPGTAGTALGSTNPVEVWQVGEGNFDVSVVSVAAGDFTGDGRADLIGLYDYSQWVGWGAAGLFVFPGAPALTAGSTGAYEVWYGGANSLDAKAARIAAGDFNGDGRADLVGLYDYSAGYGWASAGLFVFAGTPSLSAGSTSFYETWFTGPGNFDVTRTAVGAGDWNRDGRADLVALYDYSALGWYATDLFVFPGTASTSNGSTTPYSAWQWVLGSSVVWP